MNLAPGIIPPLVTPLAGRDELDHEGLERLLEHLIAGGVSGLFPNRQVKKRAGTSKAERNIKKA